MSFRKENQDTASADADVDDNIGDDNVYDIVVRYNEDRKQVQKNKI